MLRGYIYSLICYAFCFCSASLLHRTHPIFSPIPVNSCSSGSWEQIQAQSERGATAVTPKLRTTGTGCNAPLLLGGETAYSVRYEASTAPSHGTPHTTMLRYAARPMRAARGFSTSAPRRGGHAGAHGSAEHDTVESGYRPPVR